MLRRIADNRDPRSIAARLRRRRSELFSSLLSGLPDPIRVLDVGGTEAFWRMAALPPQKQLRITLLNLNALRPAAAGLEHIAADACAIPLRDGAFDVVFSNSVIEHVGGPEDQLRMADEIRRVGKRYFVQTPNRFFPIEPHFLFPFFQFLPGSAQGWLLRHFDMGWFRRTADPEAARQLIAGVRLLGRDELSKLFPEARLYEEKLLGLTKSFVLSGGW